MNIALGTLQDDNRDTLEGVLEHIDFMRTVGRSRIPDQKLRQLITHFNKYRLRNDDFEFPDLLGAAYEFLIAEFADSAGKKGGEFYTPRDVVRLMVRILDPQEGMRIYDPCVGSGGMLIISKEYVEEQGGDPKNLRLYGQDNNGGVWAICKMNMILHGISGADIQNDDSLESPQHIENGELLHFDRVISNPPFSQNYTKADMTFKDRFTYGFAPEAGKKADLMFAQHMLSVLRATGMMATVMPHGVLFRGGDEKRIRQGFLADDVLEAVIGLPPNLFYGTGIPACILVMRPKGTKPPERRGKVLFINADAEFFAGRAQNYLRPEHVEKIVSTFRAFTDVPRYARVVTVAELTNAENDANLNIRRYADNAPPPEPQDVRAHLVGGIPRAEVAAKAALFGAHGFDPQRAIFVPRDERYLDFAPTLTQRGQLRALVEDDPGVRQREADLRRAFDGWWAQESARVAALPESRSLSAMRAELLATFAQALTPVGLLDPFEMDGLLANWWQVMQSTLRTLMEQGFTGLEESWATTLQASLWQDDDANNGQSHAGPIDRAEVQSILLAYLAKLPQGEGESDTKARMLRTAFTTWWKDVSPQVDPKLDGESLIKLLRDFVEAAAPLGLLDRFKVDGVIASWWNETQYDLRTLAAQGFDGLADSWVATIVAALEPDENGNKGKAQGDALDHKMVRRLLPEYLEEIAAVEARKAEVESQIEAAKGNTDEENDDSTEDEENALTEEEVKALKRDLAAARKRLNELKAELISRLQQARDGLNSNSCRHLALDLLRDDLAAQMERYVAAHRQQIVQAVELWWDKYRVTLLSIEAELDLSSKDLSAMMKEIGYAN